MLALPFYWTIGVVGWITDIGTWFDTHNGAIAALAALFVAAFTFTLWRSTNSLWNAGERQLAHLEITAQRQLRAYVLVDQIETGPATEPFPLAGRYQIDLKNFGQTPAHDVATHHTVHFGDPDETRVNFTLEPVVGDLPSRGVLGPGGTVRLRTPDMDMTREEKARVTSGSLRLYIFGEVRYRDAFGCQHVSTFRYKRDMNSEGVAGCFEGNTAD